MANGNALHDHALQLEKHAEALHSGLSQMGAEESEIAPLKECADIGRQYASALAKSENTGTPEEEKPAEENPDDQPPPQQKESGGRTDFASASRELSQDVQRKKRQTPPNQ